MSTPNRVLDFPNPPTASQARRNEARNIALQLVRDPLYRTNLMKAMQSRTVAPAVEIAIWAYAFGKPPQRLEVGLPGDFENLEGLTEQELAQRARVLVAALEGNPDALNTLAKRPAVAQAAARAATDGAIHEPEY